MKYKMHLTHALEKIFPHKMPSSLNQKHHTLLQNQHFAFQLAHQLYTTDEGHDQEMRDVRLEIQADQTLLNQLSISEVQNVPVLMPCYPERYDENYLFTTPGLAPDVLKPMKTRNVRLQNNQWRGLWLEINTHGIKPGDYDLKIVLKDKNDGEIFEDCLHFTVIAKALPAQELLHTCWFHVDSLAHFYDESVFSERLWEIVGNFMDTAAKAGVNMLLTPIFTPPLDTEIGGERLTVQLVKMKRIDSTYHFDFCDLGRWIDLAQAKGIPYFEMAHLFTQWGAKHAPKIMCEVGGQEQRIFGWETDASGPEYADFLQQFLPALKAYLQEKGVLERSYFHISDEPYPPYLENYRKAKAIVAPLLEGCHIMDALNNIAFYREGIVENPVPATNHIEEFLDAKINNLWAYYCCSQNVEVSNRFIAQRSSVNRILGVQLYLHHIKGFLHWGYNFYQSQHSIEPINPYLVNDANGAFPAGDPFVVYPGQNGKPLESIRGRVFLHGLEDLRALKLLESLTDYDFVRACIHENVEEEISFSVFPREDSYLLGLRERINREIAKRL